MNPEELKQRTKQFAHRCVKLALALPANPLRRHIQGRLIRYWTGAAAKHRAARVAQSRAAFVAKLSIAVEEVDEPCIRMEFITDESVLPKRRVAPLLAEGEELKAFSIAARHTTRTNPKL